MFIRYYDSKTLLELFGGTQYGQAIAEFLEDAVKKPFHYRYCQIGDMTAPKSPDERIPGNVFDENWLDTHGNVYDVKERMIEHPVIFGRYDRWFAVCDKDWNRLTHAMRDVSERGKVPIFYAMSCDKPPMTPTSALEFSDYIREGLRHATALGGDGIAIQQQHACALELMRAWEGIQITLWHQDLWQAALSGAEIFQDHILTWEETITKLPRPQLWLLDKPVPIDGIVHKRLVEGKLLGMFLFPADFVIEDERGRVTGERLATVARLLIIETADTPLPILEWITFTIGFTEQERLEGRTLRTTERPDAPTKQGRRTVSISDSWALLEFMNQPIIKVTETPPPRHIRRQAERAKRKLPSVQTVYLRRQYVKPDAPSQPGTAPEAGPQGEHVKREYNFQWLVGGHWRNQFYPSQGIYKKIYIAPYLKGDESKPFKAPGVKVYQVVR